MELWFSEDFSGGSRFGARVSQVLASEKSDFQQIDILQTEAFGRMLIIDGKVQACELDEFIYHEMLVHPALLSHKKPSRVLVAGGGDGGTVRECLKHKLIQEVTLVEIDPKVIDLCSEHMPALAKTLTEDSRVKVTPNDAVDVIRKSRDLDAIFVDSSDPVGPSEALFKSEFIQQLWEALAPHGMACLQAGSPFLDPDQVTKLVVDLKRFFPMVHLLTIPVPSYPGGTWCLAMASKDEWNPRGDGGEVLRQRYDERGLDGQLKYLTRNMLGPCFEVPAFLMTAFRKYQESLGTVPA